MHNKYISVYLKGNQICNFVLNVSYAIEQKYIELSKILREPNNYLKGLRSNGVATEKEWHILFTKGKLL